MTANFTTNAQSESRTRKDLRPADFESATRLAKVVALGASGNVEQRQGPSASARKAPAESPALGRITAATRTADARLAMIAAYAATADDMCAAHERLAQLSRHAALVQAAWDAYTFRDGVEPALRDALDAMLGGTA